MRFSLPTLAGFLTFATACDGCSDVSLVGGAGGGAAAEGGAGGGGISVEPPAIDWYACPDEELADLTCADVDVPLDWDAPASRSIPIHVRRLEATEEPTGAVWLLEGGPGVPGSFMLAYAAHIHSAHPSLDVFVPDHRGTGESAPLVCSPQTDPPTPACMTSLREDEELVLQVNSSAAARDVAAIAEWTKRGESLSLYGRSYGTYWAHRTVSLAPGRFDKLVLDSPCSPVDGCPASSREAGIDEVGRELLARYDDDAACLAHLGPDAEAFAAAVVAGADVGACAPAAAAGITGDRLRYMLARLLGTSDARGLVPAVLHRYQRCNASDEAALATLAAYFEQIDNLTATLLADMSIPANYQVTYAEWWDSSFTVGEAEAQQAAAIFATGASLRWTETFTDGSWTALPRDPALRAWHIADTPTLVLVGGLDTATPRASVAIDAPPIADHSHWVELAFAGHADSAGDGIYGACSRSLIDQFLSSSGSFDDGCVAEADLAAGGSLLDVPTSTVEFMLGTTSLYGD